MARLPKCAVGMAALLLGQALLSKADISQPRSGTWAATGGPMTEARTGASAALLPDGRVLIAGGTGADGPLATAELYDSSGFFTATTPMQQARASHACAALQDGRVLVAGGVSTGGVATSSAEVYDPATAAWSLVGDMAQARSAATATLLQDGRVLVAGGHTSLGVSPSLEIFDPATNLFTAVGRLSPPRKGHAAVAQDGVEAEGQLGHELLGPGRRQRRPEVALGHRALGQLGRAQQQVLPDRAPEEEGLLGEDVNRLDHLERVHVDVAVRA